MNANNTNTNMMMNPMDNKLKNKNIQRFQYRKINDNFHHNINKNVPISIDINLSPMFQYNNQQNNNSSTKKIPDTIYNINSNNTAQNNYNSKPTPKNNPL